MATELMAISALCVLLMMRCSILGVQQESDVVYTCSETATGSLACCHALVVFLWMLLSFSSSADLTKVLCTP